MYKPNSIEQERISWKTVIYFNVVHSLKHILATLDAWEDTVGEEPDGFDIAISPIKTRENGSSQQPSSSMSLHHSPLANGSSGPSSPSDASAAPTSPSTSLPSSDIGTLRQRLTTLLATDAPLADRLSGGISVSGSGKGGVYVRSGWQARTIENALVRFRPKHEEFKKNLVAEEPVQDILVEDIGRLLVSAVEDIKDLWSHPTVKGLITRRKLKLDEWSEL